ncbi:MAG: hypothetical protein ACE361_02840 [Aureliella sp.]
MRQIILPALLYVALPTISLHAEVNHQEAFQEFSEFMVGVWVNQDRGNDEPRLEHTYEWTLDKKFVRTNGELDPIPWHGYFGMDLNTGKLAWHAFLADGRAGTIELTDVNQDHWIFEGNVIGPDGPFHKRVSVIKTSSNELTAEIADTYGEETHEKVSRWKRHRTHASEEDFQEFCRLVQGRWVAKFEMDTTLKGFGDDGEEMMAHFSADMRADRNALVGTYIIGGGSGQWILSYDKCNNRICSLSVASDGRRSEGWIYRVDGQFVEHFTGHDGEGNSRMGWSTLAIDNDGETHTWTHHIQTGIQAADKDSASIRTWHRVHK